MRKSLLGFCFLVSVFYSCSNNEKAASESVMQEDGSFEQSEKVIEEKRVKGDTLAMPFQELKEFFPVSIDGFVAGEFTGKTENDNGMSWSVSEKKYTKGNQTLYISLADYNGAYGLFAGATDVFSLGKVDNEEEKAQVVSLKKNQIKGWESYKKNSKEVSLIIGINDRFLLTILAENQISTDFAKSVVENMDLEKLITR